MNRVRLHLLLMYWIFIPGFALDAELGVNALPDSIPSSGKDTTITRFRDVFTSGRVSGHVRSFTMATLNHGRSQDYWANAVGGLIQYETAPIKGFKMGVKGIFTHRLFSSDLSKQDEVTGKKSRWELQLFDIEHPDNRSDLDRLEELYINYHFKKSFVQIGKMEINTPLINPHDARMASYSIGGVWAEWNGWKHWKINGGWFDRTAPRSTISWHSMTEAIGIYGNGYQPNGESADYHGQVISKGIGLLGAQFKSGSGIKVNAWNYLIENALNTVFLQMNQKKGDWYYGAQYLRQDPIPGAGTSDSARIYYWPSERTNLFGFRVGRTMRNLQLDLNYARITRSGRFIFPREIGREQFFVSLPRSRLEGSGDVHAATLRGQYKPRNIPGFKLKAGLGYFYFPGAGIDFQFNKYGEPTYAQFDFDAKYAASKLWEGLEFEFLYVLRKSPDSLTAIPERVFNRSNFHHLSFITNFSF